MFQTIGILVSIFLWMAIGVLGIPMVGFLFSIGYTIGKRFTEKGIKENWEVE